MIHKHPENPKFPTDGKKGKDKVKTFPFSSVSEWGRKRLWRRSTRTPRGTLAPEASIVRFQVQQQVHLQLRILLLQLPTSSTPRCVVAEESAGTQLPMAFLDRVKDEFISKYGNGTTVPASSVDREFGPKLKDQMKYCMDHPEEISMFAKVKAQVSEVKGVIMDNIDKVLDRGEKIEILVDESENFSNQAQDFRSTVGQLRRTMWIQNMKVKLIVLGILIALVMIIVLSVCRGLRILHRCRMYEYKMFACWNE